MPMSKLSKEAELTKGDVYLLIPLLEDNNGFQKTCKLLSLNVNLNFSCNYYALILSKTQTKTTTTKHSDQGN